MVPLCDGAVTIRPPRTGDQAVIVTGRDPESRRWLGNGDDRPTPTACIVVEEVVVGWVDYDTDRDWLGPGQVNVGFQVFPEHRGHGYATIAVRLLVEHLATATPYREATFLIDKGNEASLAVAARLGAVPARAHGTPAGQEFFVLGVQPVTPRCTAP